MGTYEEALLKTRDLIHTDHKLLIYPQAFSPKPNRIPCRAVLLHSETRKSDIGSIRLIEEAIEVFNKWTAIKKVSKYDERVAYGYKAIDLSTIENVVPKLQGQ